MGHVWGLSLCDTLNPKNIVVINENNCLNVSRFAFQTNINIQNGIYNDGHTHTQTQKVYKTYTKHTQEPTQEPTHECTHMGHATVFKRSFCHFCHHKVRCQESSISSIVL